MPEHLHPAPELVQVRLEALSTGRQLTALIAMEKTRLAQALDPLVAGSHRTVIRTLKAACAEVEAALDRRSLPTRSLTASAPSSPRSPGSASASPPC